MINCSMKKKVGILTYYYNNINFGGQLQAYALQHVLENLNCYAEQICYSSDNNTQFYELNIMQKIIHFLTNPIEVFQNRLIKPEIMKKMEMRKQKFVEFQNQIPHSTEVYKDDTISGVSSRYDVFICGSDQIWKDWGMNCEQEKRNYVLGFLNGNEKCFSYAASLGSNFIDKNQSRILSEELPKLQAISVREKEAVPLIQPFTEKQIEVVLDPVLLLSSEEWEACSNAHEITGEYIFCYFIGEKKEHRRMAKRISRKMNCKLVTIPHVVYGRFNPNDYRFGDYQDYSSGPAEFIRLIRDAKMVLTDSFHAMVFSTIFHKPFYVFYRENQNINGTMNGRITDFLEEFSLSDRLKNEEEMSEEPEKKYRCIDYSVFDRKIEKRRQESIEFLKKNL